MTGILIRPADIYRRLVGTAERQLEAILQPALRHLIPVRNFPRCVIQVTLQVMEVPENAYVNTKVLQPRLVSDLVSFVVFSFTSLVGGRLISQSFP